MNFKNLINKYSIQIPIIQRDYAQGRDEIKVKEIRDNFLETIKNKLEKNEILHLDFVYGSIKNNNFIPLDGQQRLTTLFLLYFYFGKKENQNIEYLSKFTYETRSSSREFCQKLVSSNIDLTQDILSEQIKESSWFLPYWDNDPTIKSVFIMLDSIHQKFRDKTFFSELDNITFEFFELEKFGLDDDLYIKMNARGKPLTPFENFKASFEAILEKIDKDLKNEFSNKIDKEWIDIFWKYKDKDYLIDEAFMNYFYYITEMLYIKQNRVFKELSNIELKAKVNEIYNNSENIKFLFDSIDNLPKILDSFEEIFSKNQYEINKICLFDNDINLSEKIIKQKPVSLEQKIILFIAINHCIEFEINDNLKNLIRVMRNLLIRIRGLKQSQLYYTQNLRYENLNAIINFALNFIGKDVYQSLITESFDLKYTAISKDSLSQEESKAQLMDKDENFKSLIFELEDFKYLKGDINNFLIDDIEKFKNYKNSIIEIYAQVNDTLIVQVMLTCGNYGLWRGWAGGSSKYFFGKNKYWDIILTNSDKRDFFHQFLDQYLENNKSLHKMKKVFLDSYTKKDWRYYFIKYDEMINTEALLSKDNNVYAWHDDFSLEKMGGANLNAYHINSYIRTVAIKNKLSYTVFKWDGYSYLSINKRIKEIYSTQSGWEIIFDKSIDNTLKDKLVAQYSLENIYINKFVLKVKQEEDRIELMNKFINDIKQYANKT
jgi:hypothetical protein